MPWYYGSFLGFPVKYHCPDNHRKVELGIKDSRDVLIFSDGSWCYRADYCAPDEWRGDDFDVLYVGTSDYNDFLKIKPCT
ncbi:hypothetical protein H8900_001352 [Salmonella enterica]|nr:hypothetical protein [Salmonella enterica]